MVNIETLENKVKKLNAELEHFRNIESNEKSINEMKECIEEMEEQVEICEELVDEFEPRIETLEKSEVIIKEDIKTINDKINTTNEKVTTLDSEVKSVNDKVNNIKVYNDSEIKKDLLEQKTQLKQASLDIKKLDKQKADKEHKHVIDDIEGLPAFLEDIKNKPSGPISVGGYTKGVRGIVAGTGITIDETDPRRPIVNATGGGGGGGAVDSVNGQTGVVVLDADDIDDTSTTNKFVTATDISKLGNISVTQPVDLDQMEEDINALANGMVYKGNWDASVGTFPGAGIAQTGWFYTVSVGGTVNSVVFNIGDRLIAIVDNASTTTYAGNWTILDATDAVTSVNGMTGNVTGLVPYTGATADLNLGTYDAITDTLRASTSAGLLMKSENGTDVGLLGALNTANIAWYGNHNYSTATQDTIAIFTGAGKTLGSAATATYPSLTELAYVKGVTSAIQTQLDAKITASSSNTLTNKSINLTGNTLSGTKAQFNTAVSDGDIVFLDSVDTITGVKTMNGLNVITHSSAGLIVRNPANTFSYTITGAAIAAARQLNLPLITATDTLVSLGLAQTFTGAITFNNASVLAGAATMALFNTTATTITFAGAATTLTVGGTPTTAITHNYSTNATATGTTKTVNLGTGGAAGSTTNINIGSSIGGTTTISSPTTSLGGTTGVTATGTIELGHATDTTISRVSAGRIAVEGVNVPTISSTDALTNKSVNGVTLVSGGSATKYLSEDGTYTTPAGGGGGGGSYKWAIAGTIGSTGTNVANTILVNSSITFTSCNLRYGTAGSGTLTVDINKNGTTLYSTTKPSITTTNQTSVGTGTLTTTTAVQGDLLTIDIDAVPGTVGVDLYVELFYS